jgi:hypothetical protein
MTSLSNIETEIKSKIAVGNKCYYALAVAYRGGWFGGLTPPPRNSEILTKHQKLRKFYYMK